MYTDQDLAHWRNPILDIKDPLKQRWAEIVQIMDTHINGICPIHIYFNCRPIESQDPFAIAYRVNNFEPNTLDPFSRTFSGIIQVCTEAAVNIKTPDLISNGTFEIKGKDVYYYCNSDLVILRENDPQTVAVVMPKIKSVDEKNVSIIGVDILMVRSSDIDIKADNELRFVGGEVLVKDVKQKYYFHILDGQYSLDYPQENGSYKSYPIVKIDIPHTPYIETSTNVVKEGKYTLRLPYLYGSAAWGNKYYSQETDYNIQLKRNTYPREIRAKEKCDMPGYIMNPATGLHINAANQQTCTKCAGTGYKKDDSPLGTIFVDFDKLAVGDNNTLPSVVTWAEPPQAALTNSGLATDKFFNNMCDSLGLVKQNNTNQSALSKEFDFKEKISVIYKIFNDNIRVAKEIYRHIEVILLRSATPVSEISLTGELGKTDLADLLDNLNTARTNNSPPFVIIGIIDQIYQKTLPPDIVDVIIQVAKKYDVLYQYGSADLIAAKAQLGNAITERMVNIHNSIIDVLVTYMKENGIKDAAALIKYLDTYYPATATQTTQPANTFL